MSAQTLVRVEDDGAVRILTLDSPSTMNGLSAQLRDQFMAAFDDAVIAGSVEAIVVTGAGGNFSAGGDISAMRKQTTAERVELLERIQAFMLRWPTIPKPILVAVEGVAAGGGVAMTLSADWAVAATDARFVAGWLAIALAPDMGAAWWAPRALGTKRAFDWLHGARIGATDALASGLISALCEPGEARAAAVARAKQLLTLPAAGRAATKRLIAASLATADRAAFARIELDEMARLIDSDDHRVAVEAFLARKR